MISWNEGGPLVDRIDRVAASVRLRAPPPEARLKSDPGTTLYRLRLPGRGDVGPEVMLKVYTYEGWLLALRARLFRSRARREFDVLLELARRGVPSLEPVAVYEHDAGPLRRASALATVWLEDAWTLEELVLRHPTRAARRAVLDAVAREVRSMHEAGFTHGTLFPRNVLLPGPGAAFDRPRLFDAPHGRFTRAEPVPDAARARDLACLYRFRDHRLQRGELARFLRVYLGRSPGTGWGAEGRRLARALLASTAFTRSFRRKLWFRAARLFGGSGPVH